MNPARGIAVLSLIGLALTSPDAQAGCEKDTDCKGDRICVSSACADPTPTAAPDQAEAPAEPKAEQTAEAPAEPKAEQTAEAPAEPKAEQTAEAPAEGEAAKTDEKAADEWWQMGAREAEAALLQEIFNELPKPVKTKGAGKLVYQRSVPLVIADIHDVTAVWGSKLQKDVHFLGISKTHTTDALVSIGPDTAGVAYCPLACNRLEQIFVNDQEITLQYDGPIKDWAGKAADNVSGYTRRFGKIHQAKCSFPLMVKHAPANTWLDPEQVTKVRTAVVDEIKRYCGKQ